MAAFSSICQILFLLLYYKYQKMRRFYYDRAYKKFWKGYVDFEGRSTRSDYWFAYLANMLTVIAFYVLLAIFGGIASATESSFLAVISFIILFIFFAFGIAAILPGIAV